MTVIVKIHSQKIQDIYILFQFMDENWIYVILWFNGSKHFLENVRICFYYWWINSIFFNSLYLVGDGMDVAH